MVGSSCWKMIVNSRKWQRSAGKLCSQCTVYEVDSLVVDGFRCNNVTIQEATLAKDLVVDGETYQCVEILLYGKHS